MKLGLGLPQRGGTGLRGDLIETARAAETAGFASLWVYDRLLYPLRPLDGMYGVPDLSWSTSYEETADPLAVLAAAAAVTESIRLGASMLVRRYPRP